MLGRERDMSFCTTFFHLGLLACFGGVKQTNRYLSVAFSGLKIGMEFTSKNVFSSPVHHRKNAVSVYLLLMQS